MTLRFRVDYRFEDYNREAAESGFTVVDVSNMTALDSFVLLAEPILQALSNAPIRSALAYAKMPPYVDKPLSGPALVTSRLLCLFTDGARFGSFGIPAARQLVTAPDMSFGRWRLLPGSSQAAQDIDMLGSELAKTLLADGSPFPFGAGWRAAYSDYRP